MKVYVGIGSNIDAEKNIKKAAELLRLTWLEIRFSSVYASAPRDKEDQPDFLNAVAVFETELDATSVRLILRAMEVTLGKKIEERFGPRTIDLDLLLYGNETLDTEDLTIPHPRMRERRFVLEPLAELSDEPWVWESLEKVQQQECRKTDILL